MTADDSTVLRPRLTLGLLQTLGTVVLVVFILKVAAAVIIPVLLSILFVFVLSPLVRLGERYGLPRTPAVLLTLLLTGAGLAGVGYVISGQVLSLARELPDKKANIQKKLDDIRGSGGVFSNLMEMVHELIEGRPPEDPPPAAAPPGTSPEDAVAGTGPAPEAAQAAPTKPVDLQVTTQKSGALGQKNEVVVEAKKTSGVGELLESVEPIAEPLAGLALIGILVLFMLVNREDVRNRVIGLVGRGRVTGTTRVLSDAAERVSTLLLFQLIVNACFGVLFAIGLSIIGVGYAPLWGFLSMLLRFVPYVGTWLSALFPFIISFATSDGWGQPLAMLGYFIVLDVVIGQIIEPLLFGHKTGVSPIALLIAAAFWTWVWGPIGLLLSTPITVCLAVIGQHVPKLRPLALLLGDKPALEPHLAFYQRLLAKDRKEAALRAAPPTTNVTAANETLGSYDTVVVPALLMARKDRERNDITAAEETEILDMTRDIIAETVSLKESATDEQKAAFEARQAELAALPVVVGAPSHHRVEELTLDMLAAGLPLSGRRLVSMTARQLPLEVEQAITTHRAVAAIISVLPPGGVPQAVFLVKRLRKAHPNLTIVVAYFGRTRSFDDLLVKFRKAGATYVTTSLVQTADTVKAMAAPSAGTPASPPKPQPVTA